MIIINGRGEIRSRNYSWRPNGDIQNRERPASPPPSMEYQGNYHHVFQCTLRNVGCSHRWPNTTFCIPTYEVSSSYGARHLSSPLRPFTNFFRPAKGNTIVNQNDKTINSTSIDRSQRDKKSHVEVLTKKNYLSRNIDFSNTRGESFGG